MRGCVLLGGLVLALGNPRRAAADPSPWAGGTARGFVAGELGGGLVAKAQVAAGWGRPHWQWAGAEVLGLSTLEFGAVYGGGRVRLPFLDLTAGARWTDSYVHPRLAAQPAHAAIDGDAAGARGWSFDASLTLYGPAPRGYLMLWGDVVHPFGIAAGTHLYEEFERAVVGRGTTVALRGAYLGKLDDGRWLIGPMLEHVWLGGRDAGAWRAGGVLFRDLSRHWQAAVMLTAVVRGPDDLTVLDGMWGTAMVRYRWATGR